MTHRTPPLNDASRWTRACAIAAVAGALLGALIPRLFDGPPLRRGARYVRAKSDVSNLAKAIGRLRTDTANSATTCLLNPSNLESPVATAACGATLPLCSAPTMMPRYPCWNGPYFTNIQNDPWGRPYRFELDPTTFAVTVTSTGPNGIDDHGGWDDVSYVQ